MIVNAHELSRAFPGYVLIRLQQFLQRQPIPQQHLYDHVGIAIDEMIFIQNELLQMVP